MLELQPLSKQPYTTSCVFLVWKLPSWKTVTVRVAQLCLTLCNPVDCSPPGSSVHADSPGKNTKVGCYALLHGIFPTKWSNPGLLHCRRILYHLSHQGCPIVLYHRLITCLFVFFSLNIVFLYSLRIKLEVSSPISFIQKKILFNT